jgi:tRNA G18 (ribose-2'-O)-methylase SpoU
MESSKAERVEEEQKAPLAQSSASQKAKKDSFQSFLLIHNVAKPKNVGTLVRSAAAFNVSMIYLVSKDAENKKKSKIMSRFQFFGNKGTVQRSDFEIFPSLKAIKEHFVAQKVLVCGVELTDNAEDVTKHPFKGDTCFLMGNEGTGLTPQQKEICDQFVYIPHYTDKTASLNVAVAGSIVFHHFALWANFKEAKFIGEKYTNFENGEKEEELGKRNSETH